VIRILVAEEWPESEKNALLHLFSAAPEERGRALAANTADDRSHPPGNSASPNLHRSPVCQPVS
jgi:hypothetical protein